ncbi:MAG: hypothetical protein QOH29_1752, partial [Actinomycetota bacterium]|nr:hypothetical protein [Actinomycetota bacterium]
MNSSSNAPIQTQFRTIDGLSLRFAESKGGGDDQAILLSPWPESLLAFEPTWARLAEHTHLAATGVTPHAPDIFTLLMQAGA